MAIRGEFPINGRAFAVADGSFIEVMANGTFLTRGTVSNDGQPVSMAASPQQLILASGGVLYLFDLTTNKFSTIPGATFSGPIAQVGICDDFFLALVSDSKEFYVSAPLDATDWITNGSAIISVFPDNVVSMFVFNRQIVFRSDTQSQVYYDSGNIFPFDVIQGAFVEAGAAAPATECLIDNTLMWLGRDARGQGIVWRMYGYQPQRVSNHAIEYAIQSFPQISDAIAFSYQDQGHNFWVCRFPSARRTLVYDTTTNMWHERGYWLTSIGQFEDAHYQNHMFVFGKHLVGDWRSNTIYEMHIPVLSNGVYSFADDNGNPIRRVRRSGHISAEQTYIRFGKMQVYLEAGLGPMPPFQGIEPATAIILQDSSNQLWAVQVADNGQFVPTKVSSGTPQTITFVDSTGTAFFLLGIGTLGNLLPIPTASTPSAVSSYSMISIGGTRQYYVQVLTLGNLETQPGGGIIVARGPVMTMRFSDNAGHTWSNGYDRDCGQAGEYKKRVIWWRGGIARNRTYEISTADPWAPRIIDGYVEYEQSAA